MFDLLYLVSHPLTAAIHKRHTELEEQARSLLEGSSERKKIESRIARLEEYCLPKPDPQEQEETEPIRNRYGRLIGERHSMRRRFAAVRRGRPARWRIQVRAVLEEKLADPTVTWRQLAEKYGFPDRLTGPHGSRRRVPAKVDLERQVALFKALLRKEGIPLRPESPSGVRLVDLAPLVKKLLTPPE